MKRRLITFATMVFLATTLAISGYAFSGLTPKAHAAYVPPPGSCSWVQKVKKYHSYSDRIAAYTEWTEIDGLYSGGVFCDIAKVEICRYGSHGWDGGLYTYYQRSDGTGTNASATYLAESAWKTVCFTQWSSIYVPTGQGLGVVVQWTDAAGYESPWDATTGF